MASIATHYIFSNDVLRALPKEIRFYIKKAPGAFMLGAQGPDIFFYDVIHLALTNNTNNIGSRMHTSKSNLFFSNYLNFLLLLNSNKSENIPATAHLYGMLTHYCLDCSLHPYVYYMSDTKGNSTDNKILSLEKHLQLESDIDEILYHERFGTSINNINRKEFLRITENERDLVSLILSKAINKTYGYNLKPSYIRGTIKRACFFNSCLQNNGGIKKKLLTNIEKTLTGHNRCSRLIFDTQLPDRKCMNEAHHIWRVPKSNKIRYDSVYDLYNKALKRAVYLISDCHKRVYSNSERDIITKEFAGKTGGFSYHTGMNYRLGE